MASCEFDLCILTPTQRAFWPRLASTPPDFVLYGGTALALRLGHRESVDFDFFAGMPFDPDLMFRKIDYLANGRVSGKSENTLDVEVQAGSRANEVVKISLFGGLGLGQINQPDIAPGNNIAIASLEDIFGMKCATIIKRAETKDYLDIHAILSIAGLSLTDGLVAAGAIYGGRQYNPLDTLKAITYFQDLDDTLTPGQRMDLSRAAKNVDIARLPAMVKSTGTIARGSAAPGETTGAAPC